MLYAAADTDLLRAQTADNSTENETLNSSVGELLVDHNDDGIANIDTGLAAKALNNNVNQNIELAEDGITDANSDGKKMGEEGVNGDLASGASENLALEEIEGSTNMCLEIL